MDPEQELFKEMKEILAPIKCTKCKRKATGILKLNNGKRRFFALYCKECGKRMKTFGRVYFDEVNPTHERVHWEGK